MSGCCSAPRSLVLETTVLRVEGETCDRCGSTVEAARQAARELEAVLKPMGVRVTLLEHAATAGEIEASNTVLVNGRTAEEWLGASRVATDCPSCGDLVGESVCCAAVEIDGEVHESLSAEQIREAGLIALGLVGGGGCC